MIPKDAKKALRQQILQARSRLTQEYRDQVQAKIYDLLFAQEAYQKAETVFVYLSMGDEFDTLPIIEKAWADGKTVSVPRVHGKGHMEAHIYGPDTEMTTSKMGIEEPAPETPIQDPSQLDLIIMPCVSVNYQGARLGYGGGFYDRFLGRAPQAKIILPYFDAMVSDDIPLEPHDQPVPVVITERGVVETPLITAK